MGSNLQINKEIDHEFITNNHLDKVFDTFNKLGVKIIKNETEKTQDDQNLNSKKNEDSIKSYLKSISIVMPEVLKRCKNIKDIKKNISFITNKRPIKIDKDVTNLINDESISSLEKLSKILKKLDKWDANEIEKTIKKFLKDEELNFKDIGLPLRVVLLGYLSPIGINTIIESLGKDEVLGRIEDIIR